MKRTTFLLLATSILLSACGTNLSPHSCELPPEPDQDGNVAVDTRSQHDRNHECDGWDAAAYVLASMTIEDDKGTSCKEKSGKARQECERQVSAITEAIKKRAEK